MRLLLLGMALWAGSASAADTTVYLVRHAEKVVGPDAPKDPPLTDAGRTRAGLLAEMLADVELRAVHSTDTLRTRTTGEPSAQAKGLEVALYDHRDPEALVRSVVEAGGTHLVVGHSNTVPGLVHALGGPEGPDIHDKEYNRLYVVFVPEKGDATVQLLRFGEAPAP